MKPRTAVLLALASFAVGLAVERAIVTPRESLRAAWAELVDAFVDEEPGAMRRLWGEHAFFRGPQRVGQGDRDAALATLGRYWDLADDSRVRSTLDEVTIQGSTGLTVAHGTLVFHIGESLAAFKYEVRVAWSRGQAWQVQDLEVVSLERGVL